ncbi:zf-TFIIB domain-containing protein [Gilvimarinus sp. SDUM040013]|uniref:Zf-TFIIB domain-containing protein n=1 Tax=Gilvimarinus gilvus TaxID=3058038 RepID=A0ABU4RZ39_9GAMM|nr:zf-TFIIB domain-containing protein [Gilvimarinus sp. SDUM040013]MDO3387550.1 zf-TFIIB domain-containing protein [Gilvimarinus sp. SDUM040013]MDX6850185.1 zf-TFIIB domain-containing protein [Gilvimarinus sp. SDUM040013]
MEVILLPSLKRGRNKYPMMCPNCTERLTPTDASGIQTYTCKYCNGIWVPERSLAALLKKEGESITSHDLALKAKEEKDGSRSCATCPSIKLKVIETHKIEIDVCTRCFGLFFDQNEINNILPDSYKPQSSSGSVGQYMATEGVFWVIIAFFTGTG